MARTNTYSHKKTFVQSLLTSMSFNGILQLILVVSALAERCTRAVPVQKVPAKKMHVLRRVPASCSNWDKAWSWITNVDCGTKYRLDYITVPPREVVQYKLEYVCCDGDTDCDESEDVHSSTFDSTDEKFLAIILGSTAAAVIIIIIVVAISLCTRRRRCASSRDRGRAYDRAEPEDYLKGDTTVEKLCRAEDATSDGECKPNEPVYAEIGEETLPRYTDLFHDENSSGPHDPFVHATAPAYYSSKSRDNHHNPAGERRNISNSTEKRKPQLPHNYSNTSNISALQAKPPTSTASTIQQEANYAVVSKQKRSSASNDNSIQVKNNSSSGGVVSGATGASCATDSGGSKYYNVGEKKKKKKKKNSQLAKDRENRRRSKTSNGGGEPGAEMMVKSTSASETVCTSRRASSSNDAETTLNKQQKRRSAPPDSIEIGINSVHPYTQQTQQSSSSSSTFGRDKNSSNRNSSCDVISVCTIHEKPCPSPLSPHQGNSQSSLNNLSTDKHNINLLRKSPSAGQSGDHQLRTSSDCSSMNPVNKSCGSYENLPRSNSQPNSIIPHTSYNSASLDRIHKQIPSSRSMQTNSLSSRDKNVGNDKTSRSKEGKSNKSSQKRCSNSSSRVKDGYSAQSKCDKSLRKDGREDSHPGYSLTFPVPSGNPLEFHPRIKCNEHEKSTTLPTYENNGSIPAPPTTKSCSPKSIDNTRRRDMTSPTYDTLQYPRDVSPDRVYQKVLSEIKIEEEEVTPCKV